MSQSLPSAWQDAAPGALVAMKERGAFPVAKSRKGEGMQFISPIYSGAATLLVAWRASPWRIDHFVSGLRMLSVAYAESQMVWNAHLAGVRHCTFDDMDVLQSVARRWSDVPLFGRSGLRMADDIVHAAINAPNFLRDAEVHTKGLIYCGLADVYRRKGLGYDRALGKAMQFFMEIRMKLLQSGYEPGKRFEGSTDMLQLGRQAARIARQIRDLLPRVTSMTKEYDDQAMYAKWARELPRDFYSKDQIAKSL